MRNNNLLKLIIAALFTAIVCVTTMAVTVPMPGKGYVNAGDCFVLLSGLALGPIYGSLAAAIGSAFADIFLGYTIYAPATFIIKGLVALAAYFLFKVFNKLIKTNKVLPLLLSGLFAELIMIAGYYLYDSLFFSSFIAAIADIPGNAGQALFGIITSTILYPIIKQFNLFN